MVKFTQGDTVQLDACWLDRNNSAVTPSSQSLTITDPEGDLVGSAITNPSLCGGGCGLDNCTANVNHYFYDLDLANTCELGVYTVKWVATITGKEKILDDTFEVEKYSLRPT